jgi:hypothetical protein
MIWDADISSQVHPDFVHAIPEFSAGNQKLSPAPESRHRNSQATASQFFV